MLLLGKTKTVQDLRAEVGEEIKERRKMEGGNI